MTGGKNGATPYQNLAHQQGKRVFEVNAELEHSKCAAHPTKRAWKSEAEAIREAEARSEAARMPIVAYRCESCKDIHLCKRANARPGSILEREEPVRAELPAIPGNTDAKQKALDEYLAGRTSATTEELLAVIGVGHSKSLTRYMAGRPWHNTRGRNARWVPDADQSTAPAGFEIFDRKTRQLKPVDKPVDVTPIDLAKRRHPSSQDVGWRPMTRIDPIRHMPLGDLLDTLLAAGMEVRIQVREQS